MKKTKNTITYLSLDVSMHTGGQVNLDWYTDDLEIEHENAEYIDIVDNEASEEYGPRSNRLYKQIDEKNMLNGYSALNLTENVDYSYSRCEFSSHRYVLKKDVEDAKREMLAEVVNNLKSHQDKIELLVKGLQNEQS